MAPSTPAQVLVFTNLFPNPVNPTHGVFIQQLCSEIARFRGLEVVCPIPWFPAWRILSRFRRWHDLARIPASYEIGGIRVHAPRYLMLPTLFRPLQPFLVFLGAYRTVRARCRETQAQLIHAPWLYPDAVAAGWMARRLRLPVIPAGRGSDVNFMMLDAWRRRWILKLLGSAPAVTVVSSAMKDVLRAHGVDADRVHVIPNGVNAGLFKLADRAACRARVGLEGSERVVLFVGRLSEEKGLLDLMEAMARLAAMSVKPRLVLVGDGPQRGELESRVAALSLSGRVQFAGRRDHAEVAAWIGACDLLCLPSTREGCPNVIIEALASGRPVVASSVGGIPEMVTEDCGILSPPSDPGRLASALGTALARQWDEPAIAASMQGKTWDDVARRHVEVYDLALLSRDGPGAPAAG